MKESGKSGKGSPAGTVGGGDYGRVLGWRLDGSKKGEKCNARTGGEGEN